MFYASSFVYDGISSEELGLYIASIGGRSLTDTASLGADLNLHEEFLPKRTRSLFYGVSEDSPLEFELELAALDVFDRYQLEEIASRLAGKQEYAWLEIDQPDMRDVRYRCILNDFKVTSLTGEPLGLTCTVHCDSPYAWEYPKVFEYTVTENSNSFELFNSSSSNRVYEPKMKIELPAGAQSIAIANADDNNRVFSLVSDVPFGTAVSFVIDNDCRIINSGSPNVVQNCYTYLKSNDYKFFRLVKGRNRLTIDAPAGTKVSITCEFPKRVGG